MPQTTDYIGFASAPDPRPANRATLSSERYTSREFMVSEWENMWTRTWLLAGLASDVRSPGDYFVFEIGPESIIVARTEGGGLAAFYNSCQHRGNRLVTADRGCERALTCPYHGWTYGLDGRLKRVPDADRFPQGLPKDELSLKTVKVDAWGGLIWVNMDPDCISLDDYLGLIPAQLAPYRFEDMSLVSDQTVSLDANWKTVVDNFNEQYHVDFIHPQHASFVDCCNAENELWPFGHRRVSVEGGVINPRYVAPDDVPPPLAGMIAPLGLDPADFRGRVADIRRAIQVRKRNHGPELGFDYSGFTDPQLSDVYQYDLFPNVILTIRPEELWVMRPRPHPTDPGKCLFDKWTLQAPISASQQPIEDITSHPRQSSLASGERPTREVLSRDDIVSGRASMNITIDQDLFHLPAMQAGMASKGFKRAWLNEDESRVQHFHDWLDVSVCAAPT